MPSSRSPLSPPPAQQSWDRERWVPRAPQVDEMQIARLVERVSAGGVCLLTGAGCSTESGIPDYRGEGVLRRPTHPLQFNEYVSTESARQRYWARSLAGWPKFRTALPNDVHGSIGELERQGIVDGVITQNVDGLHTRAGSKNVVELHGSLAQVVCLSCARLESRDSLQERLVELNPDFLSLAAELAPDGDARLEATEEGRVAMEKLIVPSCLECCGVLKPRVVFFGEGVPRQTVEAAYSLVARARVLLVAGSSLAVLSGYRFVRRALDMKLPVFVVNIGETRADPFAELKISARLSVVFSRLVEDLGTKQRLC